MHALTRPEALLPAEDGAVVLLPAQQQRVHEVTKVLPPRRRLEEGEPFGLGHLRGGRSDEHNQIHQIKDDNDDHDGTCSAAY